MAGAYRLALSRATVEVLDADGATIATHGPGTVTLRDGVAQLKVGGSVVTSMPATDVERAGARNRYTIAGTDGTSWLVSKKCGCAGGGQ